MIQGDPLSQLLLFPEADVKTSSVLRKFRTVAFPVPGQAK